MKWRHCLLEVIMKYRNEQVIAIIEQHIHSERDRGILKRNLCDGIGYEALAEEFQMSRSQIARIVPKGRSIVFSEIN